VPGPSCAPPGRSARRYSRWRRTAATSSLGGLLRAGQLTRARGEAAASGADVTAVGADGTGEQEGQGDAALPCGESPRPDAQIYTGRRAADLVDHVDRPAHRGVGAVDQRVG